MDSRICRVCLGTDESVIPISTLYKNQHDLVAIIHHLTAREVRK